MSNKRSQHETSKTLWMLINSMPDSAKRRRFQHLIEDIKKMEREKEESAKLIKQLRDMVRANKKKQVCSGKGGKGKNTLLRNREMDDAFLTGIASLLELHVLIKLSAMPPNEWLKYDVVFGSICLPADFFKIIRPGLNSGEKIVMSAVGTGMMSKFSFSSFFVNPLTYDSLSGAMALAFVQMLNNLDGVIEDSKKDRVNMGGIWTSKAAKVHPELAPWEML